MSLSQAKNIFTPAKIVGDSSQKTFQLVAAERNAFNNPDYRRELLSQQTFPHLSLFRPDLHLRWKQNKEKPKSATHKVKGNC